MEKITFVGSINIEDIVVSDRARKEMGDVDAMVASIKEFGLIQPIVLGDDHDGTAPKPMLIAGGRRLAALKKLGFTKLEHAVHWVSRNENNGTEEGKLRIKSMELEENLRRKDMTWPEIIAAKQKLLEIMEKIHGPQKLGGLTREERRNGTTEGFGVRKLAAMLGESPATVSQDLKLAAVVSHIPALANIQSKEVASRQATGMILAAALKKGMITQAQMPKSPVNAAGGTGTVKALEYRVMIFCKDEQEQAAIMAEMLQRGLKCQAVIV